MPALRFAVPALIALLAIGLSFARSGDEEEEIAPKKPSKKVVVEDDVPGGSNSLPDLVRAAASAGNPGLKKFYQSVAAGADRITLTSGKSIKVMPLPYVWERDREKFRVNPDGFGVTPLDDENKAGEVLAVMPKDVQSILAFEHYAVRRCAEFLSSTAADAPPLNDRLQAAERALTATLFFHESAVQANRRRGASWEPFQSNILEKLLETRLALVRQSTAAKDWRKQTEQVSRYLELYKTKPKVVQELLAARLLHAADLIKSMEQKDLEMVRDILAEFDGKFPNANNETAKAIRAELAEKAKKLLDEATRETDKNQARKLLNTANSLNPNDAGLLKVQKELKAGYSQVVVGVLRMPRLMSPATAREDSEKLAVDLLFESLVGPIPDERLGTAYRTILASHKPVVSPLARDVTLLPNAEWGRREAGTFEVADLLETVRMMKANRALPSTEAADWLGDAIPDPLDPQKLRLKFSRSSPDPRTVLTFPILPGQWLAGQKKSLDDLSFAREPFGTGPFKVAPDFIPTDGDAPVKQIRFAPNPNYWRRSGRVGQPEINEIQFASVAGLKPVDLLAALNTDQLHLMLDAPTSELEIYSKSTRASVVTPITNRRIQILAMNHKTPMLQNADIRRGISLAIDRELILNEVYRSGMVPYHKALAGPYPPGSWQAPPENPESPKSLFDKDLAAVKLRAVESVSGRLGLIYPSDDIRAKAACDRIASQVNATGKVELVCEGVTAVELRLRVETQSRYDLAYIPFDYPDIWHSHALAAFLDGSASGKNGRNFCNYLAPQTNPTRNDERLGQVLGEVRQHRDGEGDLKRLSKDVWERFNETMPFVPLWQLDRHLVISNELKLFADGRTEPLPADQLDMNRLFSNASRWRMGEGK